MSSSVVAGVRARGRRAAFAAAAVLALVAGSALTAGAEAAADDAASGDGVGVSVVGHADLGGGPNGHVAVLDDVAFVGHGTNGGFALQWNKTPTCKQVGAPLSTVKAVSLANPSAPAVVGEITLPPRTLGRDVAVLRVPPDPADPLAFHGDLLAIGLEACNAFTAGLGGVQFYDVSDPSLPLPLGYVDHWPGTREVQLVQRDDGRVLAVAAAQFSGVWVIDATNPLAPAVVSEFEMAFSFSDQECRPFRTGAQGVSVNADGTRAYAAWQDDGLYALDISDPGADPAVLSTATYDPADEGNQFRYVPNAGETLALATDEDLDPATTTLTVADGHASTVIEPGGDEPGVFRGCEALWGGPLYRAEQPEIERRVVWAGNGCLDEDYDGLDVGGAIVLTDRGGQSQESPGRPCFFDERARAAEGRGAVAVLIANTVVDHHAEGGEGRLFSPDAVEPVDAGVGIPVAMVTKEAGDAIKDALLLEGAVTATLADEADTWGALRVVDLDGATPQQVANVTTEHTTVLPASEHLYHAVNALWGGDEGDQALVAWMSDGLRVVDLSDPAAPALRASFVPQAAPSATGDYPEVPLVVDVEQAGERVVAVDVNAGLFVLDVALDKDDCKDGGWERYGFDNQGQCVTMFDDE